MVYGRGRNRKKKLGRSREINEAEGNYGAVSSRFPPSAPSQKQTKRILKNITCEDIYFMWFICSTINIYRASKLKAVVLRLRRPEMFLPCARAWCTPPVCERCITVLLLTVICTCKHYVTVERVLERVHSSRACPFLQRPNSLSDSER